MNLFTEYTEEEILLLLSLTNNKYKDIKKEIKLLEDLDDYSIDRDIKKLEIKEVEKKSVINNYDMIYVVEGEVGIVKDNTLVSKIKKDEIFGIKKIIDDSEYYLVTTKDSKILFIEFKNTKNIYFKIISQIVSKYCKEKNI
jgi:hypothetical protein